MFAKWYLLAATAFVVEILVRPVVTVPVQCPSGNINAFTFCGTIVSDGSGANGMYIYPGSGCCNYYIDCVAGVSEPSMCTTSGTFFNNDTKACQTPDQLSCARQMQCNLNPTNCQQIQQDVPASTTTPAKGPGPAAPATQPTAPAPVMQPTTGAAMPPAPAMQPTTGAAMPPAPAMQPTTGAAMPPELTTGAAGTQQQPEMSTMAGQPVQMSTMAEQPQSTMQPQSEMSSMAGQPESTMAPTQPPMTGCDVEMSSWCSSDTTHAGYVRLNGQTLLDTSTSLECNMYLSVITMDTCSMSNVTTLDIDDDGLPMKLMKYALDMPSDGVLTIVTTCELEVTEYLMAALTMLRIGVPAADVDQSIKLSAMVYEDTNGQLKAHYEMMTCGEPPKMCFTIKDSKPYMMACSSSGSANQVGTK